MRSIISPDALAPDTAARRRPPWQTIAIVTLLLLTLVVPAIANRYLLALAISVLFWTYLSGCWNIVGGVAGQFSLGHAAFFGIGAYASGWLYTRYGVSPWLGMLVGIALSAAVAVVLGSATFRYKLTGAYFAIGTLAFSEVVRTLAGALPYFGQGSGITIALSATPGWALLQFQQPAVFYYLFLAMAFSMMLLTWQLKRSRFGYRLAAIRDSEPVADSLGINVPRTKLKAFVLSAALAAPAGTLYGQYLMFVDPNTFLGLGMAVQIVLPAVVGGPGTVVGPLLGSILLALASEGFNHLATRPGIGLLAYGCALMVVAVFLPSGLWPAIHARLTRTKGANDA